MPYILLSFATLFISFTGIGATFYNRKNGSFRDIKLVYKGRLLKVYININENNLFSIIQDAETVLRNYIFINTSKDA